MSSILELIKTNSWQIVLMGFIGCCLVGLIKTPIRAIFDKKFISVDKESAEYQKANTIYDACVFVGTFIMAIVLSIIYLAIIHQLIFSAVFEIATSVWIIQNTLYGIWRKFGVKKLAVWLMSFLKKLFVKLLDRNADERIELSEAILSIKDYITKGKLDIDKVLEKVGTDAPKVLQDVLDEMEEESPGSTTVNPSEEIKKLKDSAKTVGEAATSVVKEKVNVIKFK